MLHPPRVGRGPIAPGVMDLSNPPHLQSNTYNRSTPPLEAKRRPQVSLGDGWVKGELCWRRCHAHCATTQAIGPKKSSVRHYKRCKCITACLTFSESMLEMTAFLLFIWLVGTSCFFAGSPRRAAKV
mmetsp:Transcript_86842/g.202129  ORF Transcript_86842/g.202129 Transcript_86842/m.202129 type:complete len:127 (+) Transcript_86842:858-1238(+)